MTMETVESQHDGSITASLTESKSAHVQTQTGQNSIPALAQCTMCKESLGIKQPWHAVGD
ncbi:CREM isoform 46 [Pan troglodytes]|uniref:CREM isoform 46 n=2 Tax=Hominidae TaxID=9604 RepID=A0A2J8U357_PONAB|nr:CREM isoform 46 [Pan troglodytes]PNJ39696.1 CREM isoform 46 [Pongo abelii]